MFSAHFIPTIDAFLFQSPQPSAAVANGQYGVYPIQAGIPQELVYAQTSAAGYPSTELTDHASMLEAAAHAQAEVHHLCMFSVY